MVGEGKITREGKVVAVGIKVAEEVRAGGQATGKATAASGKPLIAIFNIGTCIETRIVAVGVIECGEARFARWRVDHVDQLRRCVGVAVMILRNRKSRFALVRTSGHFAV